MTIHSIPPARAASVALYLNESRDSILGFNSASAELRLAACFPIPAPAALSAALTAVASS